MTKNNDIYFGFVNTPYQWSTVTRPMTAAREEAKRPRRRGFRKTKTADQISDYLEDKYNITDIFWQLHEDDILGLIESIAAERLQKVMDGTLKIKDTSMARMAKPAFPKIEQMFRQFIDMREMDGIIPGVPTQASIIGKSRWFGKNPGRPSFKDTGIYRASFRCWAE
jgi:hypothetical protein